MKEKYLLSVLAVMLLFFCGVSSAIAQTAVTDLSTLSNGKVYTIEAKRGYLSASTIQANVYVPAWHSASYPINRQENFNHFAFVQGREEGDYYLYNIRRGLFVSTLETRTGYNNGTAQFYLDHADGGFTITRTTADSDDSPYRWGLRAVKKGEKDNFVNVTPEQNMLINGWGPGGSNEAGCWDEGNQFAFYEVGTLDEATLKTILKSVAKEVEHEMIESGAYYTIAGGTDKDYKYLSAELTTADKEGTVGAPGLIVRRQESDDFMSRLWRVENASGHSYKIISANTNRAINGAIVDATNRRGLKLAGEEGVASIFTFDVEGLYGYCRLCYGSNNYLNVSTYEGGADGNLTVDGVADRQVGYKNAGADPEEADFQWKFEKVTAVPVTIDTEAEYASAGYPFAVQVPEGVTAYYATETTNTQLTLEEITGRIIPAGQGALLYKQGGGDVLLTILSESQAALEGTNLLKATTAKREGFMVGETYVLAMSQKSGKAAFLKSNLTVVPSNKAYLLSESGEVAAAEELEFHFTPTGIHEIATSETLETEYYDLQGRRVLYPSNGIYVTAGGRKVYIK